MAEHWVDLWAVEKDACSADWSVVDLAAKSDFLRVGPKVVSMAGCLVDNLAASKVGSWEWTKVGVLVASKERN